MYVDTTGNVTVGVGHNLTAHRNDLNALTFTVKRLQRKKVVGGDMGIAVASPERLECPATYQEVLNDYNFLIAHTGLGTYSARKLMEYTTVELSSTQIDRLFERDCKETRDRCRKEFKAEFDTYPLTCQAALIDIAFNCGSFRSFQRHFVPAIKGTGPYANKAMSERWALASQYLRRSVGNLSRDACVKEWLMQGSRECAAMESKAG